MQEDFLEDVISILLSMRKKENKTSKKGEKNGNLWGLKNEFSTINCGKLFFFYNVCLFIYGCAGSSLLCSFPLAVVSGGFSRVVALGFLTAVASPVGVAHALVCTASVVQAHRLRNRRARASLLHTTWDLPGSGIEPLSPALAGEFFTTEPPGKPLNCGKF